MSRLAGKTARIVSVGAEPFTTELHSPFVTSRGSATQALAVAVTVKLDDGRTARGESVPVAYVTGESVENVVEAANRIGQELAGRDAARYRESLAIIARLAPTLPSTRCGLEMAVLDAWAQVSGVTLWELWGGALEAGDSDVTIPIVDNAAELAEIAYALGIHTFKLKVGDPDIEKDYQRVQAVREAAPEARLRIDANQAFTPDEAVAFVTRLVNEGAEIDLLEQPVRADDFAGMAEVARRSPVPVFADESCRTPSDALRLVTETPVQGLNCKINKSGIAGVLDIIAIARAANRKLMLGCMLETRYSISIALALACGTGAFDFLDLDSHLLLNESGANSFFSQQGSRLALPHVPEI